MTEQAVLYRMALEHHTCPYGLRALDLLRRKGYQVEDHPLTSRQAVDRFKAEHDVTTTPQIFIGGERVGGFSKLREYFGGRPAEKSGTSYRPVIAIFAMTLLMALASAVYFGYSFFSVFTLERFVAFSMCALALLKLQDVDSFANQFLNYDLLAKRYVPYAFVYPYAEAFVGVGMIAMVWIPVVAAVALFIGGVGAASVIKAVYLDKRELKCACVGGNTKVPLGAISLTENLMMVSMAVWMLAKNYVL